MKGLTTSQEQNLSKFIVPLHVLRPAPALIYVHVHVHSYSLWLVMTSELKGLMKKSSQGENGRKFVSSSTIMCIDFVVMICIIGMICIRTERVNERNYNSVYLLGRKLNSTKNCKSTVTMIMSLTSSCIV